MSLRAMELLALIVAIAVAAVAILSLGGGQTADEHPSYDYPDGVAVDWEAGTVSMEGAGTWYVLDLTAPYGTATDGGLEVAGWETMHGDTIRLDPGIYTLRTGDLEFDVVMDGETGAKVKKVTSVDVTGGAFWFVAQVIELQNKHLLVCNWDGHTKGEVVDVPQLMELDEKGKVVWSLRDKQNVGKVSAAYYIDKQKWLKLGFK